MYEQLAQYGVLGLWTAFMIWLYKDMRIENQKHTEKVISVVENNTVALARFNDNFTSKCAKKR